MHCTQSAIHPLHYILEMTRDQENSISCIEAAACWIELSVRFCHFKMFYKKFQGVSKRRFMKYDMNHHSMHSSLQ